MKRVVRRRTAMRAAAGKRAIRTNPAGPLVLLTIHLPPGKLAKWPGIPSFWAGAFR